MSTQKVSDILKQKFTEGTCPINNLWQQCTAWMKSAGVLPPEAVFTKLADFAAILKNGVLLCELAIKLSPGCIDQDEILAPYQHSPFICTQNIALFLTACREHFSIEELFKEDDLFELENFPAVLKLLSQLSRHQKSRQLGLKPFPEETVLPVDFVADESIYCNLKDEVEEQYKHLGQYAIINKQQRMERSGQEIYDSICSQKVPRNKSLTSISSDSHPIPTRDLSYKELLDNEIIYCDCIQQIVDTFYNRLRFHLRSEDMATIFSNIEEILRLNLSFLSKLRPAVMQAVGRGDKLLESNGQPVLDVATLFISYKMNFTIYAIYCSRLEAARNRIDELERNDPSIRRIIAEVGKDFPFKLQDQLAMPFQKMPRYNLLLNQLIENTTDTEQAALRNAYDAIKDVLNYMNEVVRDNEAIQVIQKIQRSISSLDVTLLDYGRNLCDDLLKVTITHNGDSEKLKQRHVFLFEKIILLCSKREAGMYKARNMFYLSDFELLENEAEQMPNKYNTISRKLTNSFFDNNTLTIVKREQQESSRNGCSKNNENCQTQSPGQSSGTSLQLIFKTVADKNKWKQNVQNAIDINNPKAAIAKGHSPLYKTYAKPTVCCVCQKLLLGKIFQGYHCHRCNRNMHRECAQIKECMIKKFVKELSPVLAMDGNSNTPNGTQIQLKPPAVEMVVSRQTIPSNASRLGCQNDGHELLDVRPQEGNTLARHSLQPPGVCLMESDKKRRSSRLSNSLSEVITLQNNGAAGTSPTPAARLNLPNGKHFVSSHIIRLSEHLQDVHEQPWYFGELGREQAKNLLDGTEDGTFLVRFSVERRQFAISFRFGGAVKHIKIEFDEENKKYFLYMERHFDSIVELIHFYRNNNLSEGFALDAILKGTPLKGNLYRAISAYSRPESSRYLTLIPGDIIRVLDTAGDGNGWWKGSINGERIGFFPVSYVIPELNTQNQAANLISEETQNQQGGDGIASTENGLEPIHLALREESYSMQPESGMAPTESAL